MQLVSGLILKQLYTTGSLKNTNRGIEFSIKNRLSDAKVIALNHIKIGDEEISQDKIKLEAEENVLIDSRSVTKEQSLQFNLRDSFNVICEVPELELGKYEIEISFNAQPFGDLDFKVEDTIRTTDPNRVKIPRNDLDDYSEKAIEARQRFVEDFTGAKMDHIKKYTFDPHDTQGNCEHFTGVAQIPMGFAGPIQINGEHAKGQFLIPLATTEGTLVASYNRGIKVMNLSGGVKCTVTGDAMQRAPAFVFNDARGAREFSYWIEANFKRIAQEAEATSSVAKLNDIDTYLASKFAFLRFNFTTGDAAGQNMVGRATFAACSWILDNYDGPKVEHFYLESNFATDKKASQINIMRTRGKRVTAEAVVKRDVLIQKMRVTPEELFYHSGVANVGSILSGANNNGLHSANAITAIFIATGQDVANVAESSAGVMYTELTKEGDLYLSLTIPSLIVATYGGGTSLATQKESLELLDCYGKGKVKKFAEIIAGAVLAGEISLASAISSSDWVSSHEHYGRNR